MFEVDAFLRRWAYRSRYGVIFCVFCFSLLALVKEEPAVWGGVDAGVSAATGAALYWLAFFESHLGTKGRHLELQHRWRNTRQLALTDLL